MGAVSSKVVDAFPSFQLDVLEHFLIRLLPLLLQQTAVTEVIHGSIKWYLPTTSQSASSLTYHTFSQLIILCWNTMCSWFPGHHCPGFLPPLWTPFSASFAGSSSSLQPLHAELAQDTVLRPLKTM